MPEISKGIVLSVDDVGEAVTVIRLVSPSLMRVLSALSVYCGGVSLSVIVMTAKVSLPAVKGAGKSPSVTRKVSSPSARAVLVNRHHDLLR